MNKRILRAAALMLCLCLMASTASAQGRLCPECGQGPVLETCSGEWSEIYFSCHVVETTTLLIRISRTIEGLYQDPEFRLLFPEEAFQAPPIETVPPGALICYYMVQSYYTQEHCPHCGYRRTPSSHVHSEFHDACGSILRCPYDKTQEVTPYE